jgi:signal transduction histidine kinase
MPAEATFSAGPRPDGVPRRRFVDRGRRVVGGAIAAGLVGTVAVAVLPELKFAYRGDETHVAIETAAFLVPALAALLFAGRAVRAQSSTDLLLACSLCVLAATNLCFSVIPAVTDEDPKAFATWAPAAGRTLGAMGFALAALTPDRRLMQPRRAVLTGLLWTVAAVAAVGLLAALLGDELPRGLEPDLSPENAEEPHVEGHALVLGLHIAILALYASATVGFLRRAERERDALLLWVALAAGLAAVARIDYFLFPSLYPEWVYVGDVLRLASYFALLVGISRELLAYQRRAADAAIFEERRRLARDLHDGLAQELAFIRSEGARLSGTADRGVLRIATAAERALGEARMAISALTRPVDEPLEVTLRRAAEAVAERSGAKVEVNSGGSPHVTTAARQSLERIVREAASNAVRHGQAGLLRIEIEADEELRVTITDDGRGFDTTRDRKPDSFGLVSMRERAETIDGVLRVRSEPGEGTIVEVTLPHARPPRAERRRG